MKWTAVNNYEEMSRTTAERIFNVISGKLRCGKFVNVGMATGNTMIRLYEMLAGMLNKSGLDLSCFYTFNLDEYVGGDGKNVLPGNQLSYRKYMKEKLFDFIDPDLGFRLENMFFPDAENPEEYDNKIIDFGGLDFQLLGIGFNGHIAFNEPISEEEISSDDFAKLPSHIVKLDSLTLQTNARLTAGNDMNAVPRKAVTMGMKSILNAKEITLLACFSEQTAPLKVIKSGRISSELPASFLLGHHNSEIVYTLDKISLE